jgi:hypothetical protein
MREPMTIARRGSTGAFALAGLLAAALAGCGDAAPASAPATPSPTPAPVETPAPSAAPTPQSSPSTAASPSAGPSAAANTFVSEHYRYSLTLPPGTLLLNWHSADRAWDGQAKVDMAGQYPDRTAIAEGGLLVIGAEAESLDDFFTRFEANGTRFHGCTPAQDPTDVTIGGVAAIAFLQQCANNTVGFARVALFKDGFGLGVWISTLPGAEGAARDRLIELLDGLEWQTG